MRGRTSFFILAAAVAIIALAGMRGEPARAGHGLPGVKWDGSVDAAQAAAAAEDSLFVIFFCAADAYESAGEGAGKLKELKIMQDKWPRDTVYENGAVRFELMKHGVKHQVKVLASKENAALMKKYGATLPDTLVLCAPNGDALKVFKGDECSRLDICVWLKDEFREDLRRV